MARQKKKTEPIVGFGKNPDEKLTVQKSTPLMSLWRSDMTLAQFKILDTYLSRINSHEPEKRVVQFEKGEIEKLLGVTKISQKDLEARIDGLGRLVPVEVEPGKFRKVALFEEAYGEADEYGRWKMHLECTAKAMKYVFNVEKIGYLRYKLRCVTSLTSRYTYVLFLYLEQNRFRKSWEIDVDELRQILNCDEDESYSAFKVFNDRILKRCKKELKEKADYEFEYVPVKKGRNVVAVKFTVKTIKDALPEACKDEKEVYEVDGEVLVQMDIDDPDNKYSSEDLAYFASACNYEFDDREMKLIETELIRAVPSGFGEKKIDFDSRRYDYLQRCFARLQYYEKLPDREPIPHRDLYLVKIIQKGL